TFGRKENHRYLRTAKRVLASKFERPYRRQRGGRQMSLTLRPFSWNSSINGRLRRSVAAVAILAVVLALTPASAISGSSVIRWADPLASVGSWLGRIPGSLTRQPVPGRQGVMRPGAPWSPPGRSGTTTLAPVLLPAAMPGVVESAVTETGPYYAPETPSSLRQGETVTVPVTLTNTTSETWPGT